MLTRRTVVLSKIEGVYNTDAVPDPNLDALLVMEPDATVDPNVLQRNFVRASLSPLAHKIGRKLAGQKFSHEFRGSGSVTVAPKLGRLLRACGYAETQITAGASQVGSVRTVPGVLGPAVAWGAAASGSQPLEPVMFTITALSANSVSITPDTGSINSGYAAATANAPLASGTALALTGGVSITPTYTGNIVAGQKWAVWWYPAGWLYTPVSAAFESVTNYMFRDGVLHKLPGGRGTFTVTAEAGNYATLAFTFTGQYVKPTDVPLPLNAQYDANQPPMVQNANLYVDDFQPVVAKLSFDQANSIVPRQDVSSTDGYRGVNITARDPKGGIDPEMTLVGTEDFWGNLETGRQMLLRMRIGSDIGNRQWVLAPAVQYTGLTYQDRDSLMVLDAGISFKQLAGDDEVNFFFG